MQVCQSWIQFGKSNTSNWGNGHEVINYTRARLPDCGVVHYQSLLDFEQLYHNLVRKRLLKTSINNPLQRNVYVMDLSPWMMLRKSVTSKAAQDVVDFR